ncbi:hypothetical protein MBAV_003218, partial [Candidatus Magnetobacterium bavaricum]
MKTDALMIKELEHDLDRLGKVVELLNYSLQQCKKIGLKRDYSLDELDRFESLTSRFARTSDLYTQKVMKGIIIILREEAKTFIDRANLFEKLEISKAEDIKLIRDLRNEISHEYRMDNITEIFEAVIEYSDKLTVIIEKTMTYANSIVQHHNQPWLSGFKPLLCLRKMALLLCFSNVTTLQFRPLLVRVGNSCTRGL